MPFTNQKPHKNQTLAQLGVLWPLLRMIIKKKYLYSKKAFFNDTFGGILVQKLGFLSIEGDGAKIILEYPDLNKWEMVDVFSQFSKAVSCAKEKYERDPEIHLLILPYKTGAAALFRERI